MRLLNRTEISEVGGAGLPEHFTAGITVNYPVGLGVRVFSGAGIDLGSFSPSIGSIYVATTGQVPFGGDS